MALHQYKVVDLARDDLERELNALGAEGWSTTSIVPDPQGTTLVILRRSVPDPATPPKQPTLGVRLTLRRPVREVQAFDQADGVEIRDGRAYVQSAGWDLGDFALDEIESIDWHAGEFRGGEVWSSAEEDQLDARLAEGLTDRKIADLHGRKEKAISDRIRKRRLVRPITRSLSSRETRQQPSRARDELSADEGEDGSPSLARRRRTSPSHIALAQDLEGALDYATNDGRVHLEQAVHVLRNGKRIFARTSMGIFGIKDHRSPPWRQLAKRLEDECVAFDGEDRAVLERAVDQLNAYAQAQGRRRPSTPEL
ncbi:hypothetical protein FRAHR75_230006 [Frankia sp. Hr75.2]|nr:hypothetical protein FRAHR75_230006 [Frankia sp. Hr75.2]